jgi:hypothetical protein
LSYDLHRLRKLLLFIGQGEEKGEDVVETILLDQTCNVCAVEDLDVV